MSLETMTKLSTVTVGAGGVSSVSFSNIPQTYTDLLIKVSARSTNSNATYPVDNLNVAFNGASAGVTVAQKTLYTYEATGSQITASGGDTYLNSFMIKAAGGTANAFSGGDMYISNYASSNYKAISAESVAEDNSTKAWLMFQAGLSSTTAPITSIQMYALGGNLVQYSTFTLYGVKAMRTAVGNSIKATGGAIAFDGTYVTHTFNTSDTFTPTTNLLVDYLVVAGGGAGNGNYGGGGGGCGGITYVTSAALNLSTNYVVTVGAGGVGNPTPATNGSNSVFNSTTSNGGFGGGGIQGGINAGPGGNAGSPLTTTGGAGILSSYSERGGGGAGAGANGQGYQSTAGGNGGAGSSNSITGTAVTRGGGGGGGGARDTNGGLGGTGGGGNGGQSLGAVGVAGTANTGAGGGGGREAYGGNGGSGVVIVRYKG